MSTGGQIPSAREAEYTAQAKKHDVASSMEDTKRAALQKARETGEQVRQTADDFAHRTQAVAERVSNKACEVCGQMRRRYPGLLTAMLFLSAFLIGVGLTTGISRLGLFGSSDYYYGRDSGNSDLHKALDTLIQRYRDNAPQSMGGYERGSSFGDRLRDAMPWKSSSGSGSGWGGWGSGGSSGYGYGRDNEGVVMRTVHDAENRLADLLHGGGHALHSAGERVRPN